MIAKERRDKEHDTVMTAVWLSAAWQRSEKMPPLESVLSKRVSPVKSDPKSMVQMLSAKLNIPLRETRLIRKDVA